MEKFNSKLLFKDIKAAHIAIEAPIQILLKLAMILLNIVPAPGKDKFCIY